MAQYSQVPFRGKEDFARMLKLSRLYPGENLHWVDLPYRLSSWAFETPENVVLWENEAGELAGWAALQPPFWSLDLAQRPGTSLLPLMLAWSDKRAREALDTPAGRPCWFTSVFAWQKEAQFALKAAGYTNQVDAPEDPYSQVLMHRTPGIIIPQVRLPAGFQVRPLAGQPEVEAYVRLHQKVFESRNMTERWRSRTLLQPDYIPKLDWVIEAPTGELVAFCIGWLARCISDGRLVGQIEPCGVHPDYRRQGLGIAVLGECLRQLEAQGVEEIIVLTDNFRDAAHGLYSAVGFSHENTILIYRKDYE